MLFQSIQYEDGWVTIQYSATWNYGYDFMLDAAQVTIDIDLKDNLQQVSVGRIAGGELKKCLEEVKAANFILRECPETKDECGVLSIAGISKWMKCPFQLTFYNQTRVVTLRSPAVEYFQENGERVFDNYLNSVEIQAYSRMTERKTIEKMNQERTGNHSY